MKKQTHFLTRLKHIQLTINTINAQVKIRLKANKIANSIKLHNFIENTLEWGE